MTSPKHTGDKQYQAEHTNTHHMSVAGYMLILFAVAFLMLLLAFFQQQRVNDEAIEGLQKESTSALASVQDIMAERDSLKEQLDQLKQELADANRDIRDGEQALDRAAQREAALQHLNQVRVLYNKGRYSDARTLIEAGQTWNIDQLLQEASSSLSEEEKALYDPYEAYQQLKGWLQ